MYNLLTTIIKRSSWQLLPVQIGKNMGVFNEMSIVLILFPMYRGNLFDFLQFDNAVFLSAFRCKGCFHICCPIQINIPIKCSIRCRCYQIYKLIDNIVADSATTKIKLFRVERIPSISNPFGLLFSCGISSSAF